ncbi:MAG: CehA/McbA family metallohydrolase [Anaerovoracaceae bacterium]|jgi:LPXTG-motif cell wall-anchored protein
MGKRGIRALLALILVMVMGAVAFADVNQPSDDGISVSTKVTGGTVKVILSNTTDNDFTDIVVTPEVPEGLAIDKASATVDSLKKGESKELVFKYSGAGQGDKLPGTVKAKGSKVKTGDPTGSLMVLIGIMIISGGIAFFALRRKKGTKAGMSILVIGLLTGAIFIGSQGVASAAVVDKTADIADKFTVNEKEYDFKAKITYKENVPETGTEPITSEPGAPNQYAIQPSLLDFTSTDDICIKTVGQWRKETGSSATFFENGEALSDHDIIVSNGKVGIVLAVGTRNPWGYPAGSVLDAGVIKDGTPKRDTIWSLEFLMNGWDSWAPENCGVVNFELVKYDFEQCKEDKKGLPAVKVSRKYTVLEDADGNASDIAVVTYYGGEKGENYMYMYDTVKNNGSALVKGKTTRFAITNKGDDGGSLKYMKDLRSVMSYGNKDGQEYSVAYTVPEKQFDPKVNVDGKGGSLGYKELRTPCNYEPGSTTVYQEYIAISDKADTSLLADTVNKINGTEVMSVKGTVTEKDGGSPAKDAVVVVKNGENLVGFFKTDGSGKYTANLPKGAYTFYVEKQGMAPGEAKAVSEAGQVDLQTGSKKADLTINLKDQDGNPVWGKVDIKGEYPEVRYTGNSVYQSKTKGVIEAQVNDINNFEATVYGEGYFFFSKTVNITAADVSGGKVDVTVDKEIKMPDGWMSGDMHHHGNKNDGFADPEDAIPSMLASGLDIAFITDHDFTVNNKKAYDLVTGPYAGSIKGFVPSEEISCSWAHFNVVPQNDTSYDFFLDPEMKNNVMNQFSTFPTFLQQTIDHGASLTANHPWYSYGLFYSAKFGANGVPGGYSDKYSSIEINACSSDAENADTIISASQCWTAYQDGGKFLDTPVEKAHYLVGGSDTHDVLIPGVTNEGEFARGESEHYATGKARTIAAVGEDKGSAKENGLAFAKAVEAGNSYVTFGPILDLSKTPGGEYDTESGTFNMTFKISSLTGVNKVMVMKKDGPDAYTEGTLNGKYSDVKNIAYDASALTEAGGTYTVDVPVASGEKTWIAILVVDNNGNYAVTNPYWITGK